MSYDWGPHYLIPSEALKKYSGNVRLREEFDEDLLLKEVDTHGQSPWHFTVQASLDLNPDVIAISHTQ